MGSIRLGSEGYVVKPLDRTLIDAEVRGIFHLPLSPEQKAKSAPAPKAARFRRSAGDSARPSPPCFSILSHENQVAAQIVFHGCYTDKKYSDCFAGRFSSQAFRCRDVSAFPTISKQFFPESGVLAERRP